MVIFLLTADFIFDRMPVGSLKSVLRQWQIAYNTLLQGSLFNGSRRALISQDGDNIYISFIQNNHADKEQFFLTSKGAVTPQTLSFNISVSHQTWREKTFGYIVNRRDIKYFIVTESDIYWLASI